MGQSIVWFVFIKQNGPNYGLTPFTAGCGLAWKKFEFNTDGSYFSKMSATVQFLTNEKGRKTAVVLAIDDYEKMLEDMDDLAVIAERRGEETIPHTEFKKGLKRRALSH